MHVIICPDPLGTVSQTAQEAYESIERQWNKTLRGYLPTFVRDDWGYLLAAERVACDLYVFCLSGLIVEGAALAATRVHQLIDAALAQPETTFTLMTATASRAYRQSCTSRGVLANRANVLHWCDPDFLAKLAARLPAKPTP